MKKNIIILSLGFAFMAFSGIACAQSYQFLSNLKVGSSGQDVSALQTWLIQNGYNIPSIQSGLVAKGLFGSQTKAAVMEYQKSAGLPVTGFVGPLTREKLNSNNNTAASATSGGTVSTVAMANGASVSPFPPGFTTPGVEGIMNVTQGPISNTTLYAGQTQVPIIKIRIQAQYSDIDVPGLVVDLGTDSSIYNFIFSKIYLMDGSNVIYSAPLNSSDVVQDSGQYIINTQGYSFIVPKGTYKDLTVAVDLYPTITSTYTNESPWYVSIDPNSVGGADGTGQALYGPPTAFYEALTINQSLVTSATANISLDGSSPLVGSVGVTNTTQGQYLGLPVMVFDVNAQGDNLHLHSVTVGVTNTGSGTVNAAYLFQGSTPVSSASVVNGVATFSNITDGTAGASIPVNTTVPFTVKVDVSGLTSGVSPAVITATTTSMTIYSSIDSNVGISGTVLGNAQTVFGQGPVFALSGTPTIAKTNITPGGSSTSTFQYTATFNVNATAIGEAVTFGLPAALAGSFGTSSTATNVAEIYVNGTPTIGAATLIGSYSQPTNTTINGNFFTLAQNQSVTIPVTYSFVITNPLANTYAVQLNGINWFANSNGTGTSTATFMSQQTAWRTSAI